MNRPPNHYKTLGVALHATPDEVRTAYRRLAKTYHPDRYEGRGDSADTMARINQAYEVLSDPVARAQHDAAITPSPRPRQAALMPDTPDGAGHRPWILVWVIVSITVLALGWVALKTLVPAPATAQIAPLVRQLPASNEPLLPTPPVTQPAKP